MERKKISSNLRYMVKKLKLISYKIKKNFKSLIQIKEFFKLKNIFFKI
jgi:hypothetical protein